ncbi:MAG: right-handed parallel beta-helix repeat-containing protein, partial [Nevskia sp.]|nr:right-handed parallel beta-helix repeat-containing protein [Nevskia sp.]
VANGSASLGTLTGTGNTVTYTAPAAAGSHAVKATSSADGSKSATASVAVLAPAVVVTDNPASATLNPGGVLAITASVSGSSNTAVSWKVDGVANGNTTVGTLTGTGNTVTYTAPAASGSHTVTATSAANAASSASTAITVQASSGTAVVSLASSGPSVNTSGSVLFTATVTGSSNTAVTWSVDGVTNGNATVGTITGGSGNAALYLAPPATGSHTITATSSADAAKSASSTLAVNSTAYTLVNPTKIFNVKTSYAATGNGTSNDTAAIQNAIDAASGAGGGVVEVPAGTYMIAANDNGGIRLASNVFLQIDSGATLKLQSVSGTSNMIMICGANNCGIIGSGTIDGNRGAIGTNESIELVTMWDTTGAVIAGVTIQNSPGDGIYLNGYPASAGVGAPVSNVLIYGATITNNGRNGMSPDGCDGLVVRDCTFSNQVTGNPMNGIDCEPINDQAPNNFLIFHNVFSGNSGGGIQSGPDDTGDNATFTNMTYAFNTVNNNGNYGIEAQDGKGPVRILNNTISNTTSSYEFGGYGIMTRGSNGISNVAIMGNSVTTSHSDGIYLGSATASVCSGNTVTSSGGKGINNQSGSGVTVS